MSVFISFNYGTGRKAAEVIARKLKAQGLDAWWFPGKIDREQLDSQIGTALANCTRCILLWTKEPMSPWQMLEISTIRHRFRERIPGGIPEECFIVARAKNLISRRRELPLFFGCEYVNFSTDDLESIDFSFLDHTPPGLIPLTYGHGRRPKMILPRKFRPAQGHHLIHGDFVPEAPRSEVRHCWMFLRDYKGQLYVQQPRPTITHQLRWAAPNIQIGQKMIGIVLAAATEWAHREIVSHVLKQNFGAIRDAKLNASLDILDEVRFPST